MKKLFEKTIKITEQDAKSHICIDFFVPDGYQKLVIDTS